MRRTSLFGILFAILTSLILPLVALIYALIRKRTLPFILGVLAFTISQLFLRIPIIDYLQTHNTSFILLSSTKPILYFLILGFSAGIFEEAARYLFMKFFMKTKDWISGFAFGLGHGGIEALIFLGINASFALFSPLAYLYGGEFFISAVERLFAIILHLGLSIIVLKSVVRKRSLYLLIAILIHSITNSLIGIIPVFLQGTAALITVELIIALVAFATFMYGLIIKRKGFV